LNRSTYIHIPQTFPPMQEGGQRKDSIPYSPHTHTHTSLQHFWVRTRGPLTSTTRPHLWFTPVPSYRFSPPPPPPDRTFCPPGNGDTLPSALRHYLYPTTLVSCILFRFLHTQTSIPQPSLYTIHPSKPRSSSHLLSTCSSLHHLFS
jgi:hypothetical protein